MWSASWARARRKEPNCFIARPSSENGSRAKANEPERASPSAPSFPRGAQHGRARGAVFRPFASRPHTAAIALSALSPVASWATDGTLARTPFILDELRHLELYKWLLEQAPPR